MAEVGMIIDGVAIDDIGRLDDVCPTCGVALARRPGRKINCPDCGMAIHCRTRPLDGAKVLVNAAEAARLEQQWEVYQNLKDTVQRASHDAPELHPLLEDLQNGRRGRTPIDWAWLEEMVASAAWRAVGELPRREDLVMPDPATGAAARPYASAPPTEEPERGPDLFTRVNELIDPPNRSEVKDRDGRTLYTVERPKKKGCLGLVLALLALILIAGLCSQPDDTAAPAATSATGR